jgi:hypothetical protein
LSLGRRTWQPRWKSLHLAAGAGCRPSRSRSCRIAATRCSRGHHSGRPVSSLSRCRERRQLTSSENKRSIASFCSTSVMTASASAGQSTRQRSAILFLPSPDSTMLYKMLKNTFRAETTRGKASCTRLTLSSSNLVQSLLLLVLALASLGLQCGTSRRLCTARIGRGDALELLRPRRVVVRVRVRVRVLC